VKDPVVLSLRFK